MKIGKTLGIGTGTVQRVVMEQPRPFDVDAAEAGMPPIKTETVAVGPITIAGRSNAKLAPDATLMGVAPKLIAFA